MSETPPISAETAAPQPADVVEEAPIDVQRELVDFGKFLLKFALIVLIIRSFILSSFNIPSESMQPRLLIGDYLIVNKAAYGWTRHSLPFSWPLIPGRILPRAPERGDVVVFKHPVDNVDYIKRVIGLPGDRIQVVDGVVRINGVEIPRRRIADLVIPVTDNMVATAQDNLSHPCDDIAYERIVGGERFCRYPRYLETLSNGVSYAVLDISLSEKDFTGVYEVGAGRMFVMGDNRDRSYDSRFDPESGKGVGVVSQQLLVGEAAVTIFSTDGSARWYNPLSWFNATRWHRIGEGF
jgi:signal peptidase I